MAAPQTPRLNNEDFRKILMTPRGDEPPTPSRFAHLDPRSVRQQSSSFSSFSKPSRETTEKLQKKKKLKQKPSKPKPTMTPNGYRDRAEERRQGIVTDYEDPDAGQLTGYHSVSAPAEDDVTTAEQQKMEIERSKYLGGDEEHTHLVKGLDFALLSKIKSDLAKQEREAAEEAQRQVQEEEHKDIQIGKVISRDGQALEQVQQFHTPMGRAIHNIAFTKQIPSTVDHFMPGRTSFVYDIDPESLADLPTTVMRAKDHNQLSRDLEQVVIHPDILSRITRIMVYYTQGPKAYKKLKKETKKEKEEQQAALEDAKKSEAMELEKLNTIFDDTDSNYVASKELQPHDQKLSEIRRKAQEAQKLRTSFLALSQKTQPKPSQQPLFMKPGSMAPSSSSTPVTSTAHSVAPTKTQVEKPKPTAPLSFAEQNEALKKKLINELDTEFYDDEIVFGKETKKQYEESQARLQYPPEQEEEPDFIEHLIKLSDLAPPPAINGSAGDAQLAKKRQREEQLVEGLSEFNKKFKAIEPFTPRSQANSTAARAKPGSLADLTTAAKPLNTRMFK